MKKYSSLLYTSKLQIYLSHTKTLLCPLNKDLLQKTRNASEHQIKKVSAISFRFLHQQRFATRSMVIKVFELSVVLFEPTVSYFCRIAISLIERLTYIGILFAIELNQ